MSTTLTTDRFVYNAYHYVSHPNNRQVCIQRIPPCQPPLQPTGFYTTYTIMSTTPLSMLVYITCLCVSVHHIPCNYVSVNVQVLLSDISSADLSSDFYISPPGHWTCSFLCHFNSTWSIQSCSHFGALNLS